jgi:hypothetical protein
VINLLFARGPSAPVSCRMWTIVVYVYKKKKAKTLIIFTMVLALFFYI